MQFSAPQHQGVWIDEEEFAQLRAALTAMTAAGAFLVDFTTSQDSFLSTPEPEFRTKLAAFLKEYGALTAVIGDIASDLVSPPRRSPAARVALEAMADKPTETPPPSRQLRRLVASG